MKVQILDAMMVAGQPVAENAIIDLPDAFAEEQITKGRAKPAPPQPSEPAKPEPPAKAEEPEPPTKPEPTHARRGSRR